MSHSKGQMAFEYAVVIVIIATALLAMQGMLRTGVMGSWFNSLQRLGEPYNPENAKGVVTSTLTSNTTTYMNTIATKTSLYTLRMDLGDDLNAKSGSVTLTAPGN